MNKHTTDEKIDILIETVSKLSSTVSNLAESVGELKDSHLALTMSVAELSASHTTLATNFSKLKDSHNTLAANVSDLRGNFSELKDSHLTLTEMVTNLYETAVHKDDFRAFQENMEKRVGHIENHMVTKEYLDKKLAETDTRVPLKRLVTILVDKDVITVQDLETIILPV